MDRHRPQNGFRSLLHGVQSTVSGNGKLQEHASILESGHILRPPLTIESELKRLHSRIESAARASQQVILTRLREASTDDVDYTVPARLTEQRLLN
jgi:hypothetical protein